MRERERERYRYILMWGGECILFIISQLTRQANGIATRVVSFPSWELFEKQSVDYRSSVFPGGVPVLSIEAASVFGWEKVMPCPFLFRIGAALCYQIRISRLSYSPPSTRTRKWACARSARPGLALPSTPTSG